MPRNKMLELLRRLKKSESETHLVIPIFQKTYEKFLNFKLTGQQENEGLYELIDAAEKDSQLRDLAALSSKRVVLSISPVENLNIDPNGKFYFFIFENLVGQVGVENEIRDVKDRLKQYQSEQFFERLKRGIVEYIRTAPYNSKK